MKVVLRSMDLSLIQSAQIALDAEGIATSLSDENMTGLPTSASAIAVLDDADFERAVAVVRQLQQTTFRPWWEGTWATRMLLLVGIVLFALICGTLLFR